MAGSKAEDEDAGDAKRVRDDGDPDVAERAERGDDEGAYHPGSSRGNSMSPRW
jgi:hypothetical protein